MVTSQLTLVLANYTPQTVSTRLPVLCPHIPNEPSRLTVLLPVNRQSASIFKAFSESSDPHQKRTQGLVKREAQPLPQVLSSIFFEKFEIGLYACGADQSCVVLHIRPCAPR